MGEQVIKINKSRLGLYLAGSIVIAVFGALLIWLTRDGVATPLQVADPSLVNTVGWIGLIFFSFCGLAITRRLLLASDGLILNEQGFIDQSRGDGRFAVKWQQVSQIGEHKAQRQQFITVQLFNPDTYVGQFPAIEKLALKSNMKVTGAPIHIASANLALSHEQIIQQMRAYLARFEQSEQQQNKA